MFNKQHDDNTPPPSPGEPTRTFQEPTLRTWKVRRFDPADSGLEEIFVTAHGITHAGDGIIFSRFYLDPVLGPQPVPVRGFAEYFDYEDVTPPAEDSRIIH